jgi:hypothetical protein
MVIAKLNSDEIDQRHRSGMLAELIGQSQCEQFR